MQLEYVSHHPHRQLAIVRVILDELERALRAEQGVHGDLHGQLADELEALAKHLRSIGSPMAAELGAR